MNAAAREAAGAALPQLYVVDLQRWSHRRISRSTNATSTTALRTTLPFRPMADRYLRSLGDQLKTLDNRLPVLLIDAVERRGFHATADEACRYPVQLLESGPAGGRDCGGVFQPSGPAPQMCWRSTWAARQPKLSVVENNQPADRLPVRGLRREAPAFAARGSGIPQSTSSTVELIRDRRPAGRQHRASR